MASQSFAPKPPSQKRVTLAEIDAVVSARLGATRSLGNAQPACFNRQVAMYLAARVGRWSTTVIGRFYNGRDHSTVCHGIQRIEELRDSDPNLDTLLAELKGRLIEHTHQQPPQRISPVSAPKNLRSLSQSELEQVVDRVADRVAGIVKDLLNEFFTQMQTGAADLFGTLGARSSESE